MPSNQCTNSLMELSFAIGNMIGAEVCDVDDWRQIRDQLASWECSERGKAGEAVTAMFGTVTNAISHCTRTGGCLESDCQDLFEDHEVLAQALNLYDPLHLGRGYRGPIPPKIKGNEALARSGSGATLAAQREAEVARVNKRKEEEEQRKKGEATLRQQAAATKKAAEDAAKQGLPQVARYGNNGDEWQPLARPSRGMGYGDEERRERWYPARV